MKRIFAIVAIIIIAAIGLFLVLRPRIGANSQAELQTEAARQGELNVTVDADGVVRSNQSAILVWHTSGMVNEVNPSLGRPSLKGKCWLPWIRPHCLKT